MQENQQLQQLLDHRSLHGKHCYMKSVSSLVVLIKMLQTYVLACILNQATSCINTPSSV